MIQWFKDLFVDSPDPYDVLKGRSVHDMSDDELYNHIDTTQPRCFRTSQLCLIVAEILRRQRKK